MRYLALDASTKTGWAVFEDEKYVESGALTQVKISDFNVNADPNKSPAYPYNILDAAEQVGADILALVQAKKPDRIVVENTVKGRNRHTQRALEWCHASIARVLRDRVWSYLDPSEWRKIVELRLSKDDKKNNRDVSAGKKRGRVTRKHLSVRMVNDLLGLNLKIKDNDQADAILLCKAATILAAKR